MLDINEKILRFVDEAEAECADAFARLDAIERTNTRKVLDAFQRHRISARHFAPTTGYGYDDIGRDTLSEMFAELMGCEAALVRPQIASGTHALALCLYGILRPGDILLAASGKPYDTLEEVIGITGTPGNGSLKEYGIEPIVVDPWASQPDAMHEYGVTLTPMEEIADLDCLILAVAHNEFRQMDLEEYLKLFRDMPNDEKVLVDVKGILNREEMKKTGIRCWRL